MSRLTVELPESTRLQLGRLSREWGCSQADVLAQLVAQRALRTHLDQARERLTGVVHVMALTATDPAPDHLALCAHAVEQAIDALERLRSQLSA